MAWGLEDRESMRQLGAGLSLLRNLGETNTELYKHYVPLVRGITNLPMGYQIIYDEALRINDRGTLAKLITYEIGDDIFTAGYTYLNDIGPKFDGISFEVLGI